jgi:hypothetical protein
MYYLISLVHLPKRAVENNGIKTLKQLSQYREQEV